MKNRYLIIVITFIFISELVQAQLSYQESINAQRKYWYYRYRLLNDFMLEGGCQGCSIPAFITNLFFALFPTRRMGKKQPPVFAMLPKAVEAISRIYLKTPTL